jgi:endosialidase-like protein
MCSPSAPPAPKPNKAIAKGAKAQASLGRDALKFAKGRAKDMEALGRDYLDFAKDQFKISQQRQVDIDARAKEISTYFMDIAKGDRERYETVFKPLEDDYIKTAEEFDSKENLEQAASEAKADVHRASAVERGAAERNQFSMGVNPNSGRFAGVDRAMGLGTAATSVDAQNRARNERRNTAIGLKRDAIGLGRDTNATAMNAGNMSFAPDLAANQSFLQSQNIVAPGYSAAQTGLGQGASTTASGFNAAQTGAAGSANTYSNLFRDQVGLWGAQTELDAANASGIGNALGTAAGIGLSFVSDEKAKKNRKKVPEGEALEAVEGMPVETYDYKPGMGDEGSHVGTMAQDFAAETGQGDGKRINVQDAIGVTMGAVKDLSAKVDRLAEVIGLGGAQPAMA